MDSERYLVDYGPKSVAVFGDTKSVKDSLKARGGRFNGRLWDSTLGVAAAGWVFSAKDKESLLQEEGGGAGPRHRAGGARARGARSGSARQRRGEADHETGQVRRAPAPRSSPPASAPPVAARFLSLRGCPLPPLQRNLWGWLSPAPLVVKQQSQGTARTVRPTEGNELDRVSHLALSFVSISHRHVPC